MGRKLRTFIQTGIDILFNIVPCNIGDRAIEYILMIKWNVGVKQVLEYCVLLPVFMWLMYEIDMQNSKAKFDDIEVTPS